MDATAHAKINLALHVVGRRADGYHLLDSLVAFVEAGDRLGIDPAAQDGLTLSGPFAAGLSRHENSLTHALSLARAVGAEHGHMIAPIAIALEKNLPVASGIGGGSADAAALLAALMPMMPVPAQRDLASRAIELGADVPMCLDGRPLVARGVGEALTPLPRLPVLPMVLANPGVSLSTPSVFRALTKADNPPLPAMPEHGFHGSATVIAYLKTCRNDLAQPAISLCPQIGACLAALDATGASLSAMSGSGATCYGLFDTPAAASKAALRIAAKQPGWWVCATATRPTMESTPT